MRRDYDPGLKATVTWDDAGQVRGINHLDEHREIKNLYGRGAAAAYIREIAGTFNVAPEALQNLDQSPSSLDPRQHGMEYRFSKEKTSFDLSTYVYAQTYLNTPVWGAGLTVTVKAPARVIGATDTSEHGIINAKLPSSHDLERYNHLFGARQKVDRSLQRQLRRSEERGIAPPGLLIDILGGANASTRLDDTLLPRLTSGQFFIYRYDAKRRFDDEAPTLPLPPVPDFIEDGRWYLVAELTFRLPHQGARMNWRILVEVESNTVLYLRALSSGLITGKVFPYDPVTSTGTTTNTSNQSNGVLNPLRKDDELHNLKLPGGTPPIQSLEGRWAAVTNITSPDFQPPTRPAGSNFDYDVRTNDFAAVSAYYHVDRFFRLVETLGFPVTGPNGYFGGTQFPVEVDHRGFRPPWPDGNFVNAGLQGVVFGDDSYGIDYVFYALAEAAHGFVTEVTVTNGGSGYTSAPTVTFTGGLAVGGTGAKAEVRPEDIVDGAVTNVRLLQQGAEYVVPPLVTFSDGGGRDAWAIAELDIKDPIGIAADWRVTLHELGGHGTLFPHVGQSQFGFAHSAGDSFAMILTDYCSDWHNNGQVLDRFLFLPFVPAVVRRCNRGVAERSVARVNVLNPGSDYLTVTLKGGGVAAAEVKPQDVADGAVTQVTVIDPGAGYTSPPSVIFSDGGGTDAKATAQIGPSGAVTAVTIDNGGSGYTSPPTVSFKGGGVEEARAGIRNDRIIAGSITRVTVTDAGKGYTSAPSVLISGGGGRDATATAQIASGSVTGITVTNGGSDYKRLMLKLSGGVAAGGGAIPATASVKPDDIVRGAVTKVTVGEPGRGYTIEPSVDIDPVNHGGGTGLTATAELGTWGWGGGMDQGTDGKLGSGYFSEQILSTTMFRAYRSIGGDAKNVNRREFAARVMSFLMLQAIGLCDRSNNPSSAAAFLELLQQADTTDWTAEGVFGGAYRKVLEWAFEKQNLNNGNPPSVDVYIDDRRAGEYEYDPVHWETTTIWNRRNPDGLSGHQEPALGQTNHAYVKIKNRGTSVANNVIVKGYHRKASAGMLWPNDLQPLTTPQLSAGTLQPNNAEEKTVGPFEWTPVAGAWGHDCMLMIVSATGDASNVAYFTTGEVIEDWRLVPNDNNIAQRNVVLVPGGGGVEGVRAGLHGKGLWVGNPGRNSAKIVVSVALPPVLAQRNWQIGHHLPAEGVQLNAREQRLVKFDVHAGAPFTKADAEATIERDIVVTVTADGAIIGGMIYRMDPELDVPFNGSAS